MAFRKYVLTFLLAVISCIATKEIQHLLDYTSYAESERSIRTSDHAEEITEVIQIMRQMKLIGM